MQGFSFLFVYKIKTMRKTGIILCIGILLTGCEGYASFDYEVHNFTNDTVKVNLYEQYQTMEDKLVMGDGITKLQDTIVILPKGETYKESYSTGLVGWRFKYKEEDTPEDHGSIPLWKRIRWIVVGNDTLPKSSYEKDKWTFESGMSGIYKLIITDSAE